MVVGKRREGRALNVDRKIATGIATERVSTMRDGAAQPRAEIAEKPNEIASTDTS
jgi:hypothetical protein